MRRKFSSLLYFDYNSTTPVLPRVSDKITEYLKNHFGNPSSSHVWGQTAHKGMDLARKQVAKLINSSPSEIIFTSCATESNNMAVLGTVQSPGDHIITTAIEHPAITKPCIELEKKGVKVTYLPVDNNGLVNVNQLEASIQKNTKLISVILANNETGVIQPIEEIGRIAEKHKIMFHTDAAQAVGKIKVDIKSLKVDMLTIAGHKIYAPKGVGALFLKSKKKFQPVIFGGDQEKGYKSGTENVPYIVGLGEACQAFSEMNIEEEAQRLIALRSVFVKGLEDLIGRENFIVHSEGAPRLPGTCSIGFKGFRAKDLLEGLYLVGVGCSAGAACHDNSEEMSSVLKAMGVPPEYGLGTIRFSLGRFTTLDEVQDLLGRIKIVFSDIKESQRLR